MSHPYIVIAGYINDHEAQAVVGLYLTKSEAESEGTKYVERFPGATVNIYSWELGLTSKNVLSVEREWYPGFELPVQQAAPPEPEPIPVIHTLEDQPSID